LMIERMAHWWVRSAEWARSFGVHPQTGYRWFRDDRMPVPDRRLPVGDERGVRLVFE
jgi:predicted site-specific integrase-resolvase